MTQEKKVVGDRRIVSTNIDRRQCKRVVPMKVLCLGLSRTGTSSLRQALLDLGYSDVYHMASAMNENPKDCEMWMDAYKALKDGQGTWGREEWDQLLGHCMAVTDNPCITFSRELIAAYPEAKVILTVRDNADAFYKSNMETIYAYGYKWHAYRGPLVAFYRWLQGPQPLRLQMLARCWHDAGYLDFPEKGKEMYDEHNEMIKSLVPADKLLVYNLKEGWGPLCGFLGEEVPERPFPKVNDMETTRQNAEFGERMFMMLAAVNGLKLLAKVGAVVAAAYVVASRLRR